MVLGKMKSKWIVLEAGKKIHANSRVAVPSSLQLAGFFMHHQMTQDSTSTTSSAQQEETGESEKELQCLGRV
jgi:hypothetical protein